MLIWIKWSELCLFLDKMPSLDRQTDAVWINDAAFYALVARLHRYICITRLHYLWCLVILYNCTFNLFTCFFHMLLDYRYRVNSYVVYTFLLTYKCMHVCIFIHEQSSVGSSVWKQNIDGLILNHSYIAAEVWLCSLKRRVWAATGNITKGWHLHKYVPMCIRGKDVLLLN